jgi:hypothetical protein
MQHLMKLLALATFACASGAAASPPAVSKPAPPTEACRATGAVLFEIDHRVDPGAKLGTSMVKVFANGAWTRDETDGDGKAVAQRTGCVAKSDLQQLAATLHGAAWKVNVARMHCMAVSATFTVFQVDGKPVFTQRLCSGESLDEPSQTRLDAAVKQVEAEVARAAH